MVEQSARVLLGAWTAAPSASGFAPPHRRPGTDHPRPMIGPFTAGSGDMPGGHGMSPPRPKGKLRGERVAILTANRPARPHAAGRRRIRPALHNPHAPAP